MLMIISKKILNKWISVPESQKGEIVRFYSIHGTNLIKRGMFEPATFYFNAQLAINIICAVAITTLCYENI